MLFISGLILVLLVVEKFVFSRFDFSKIARDKPQLSKLDFDRSLSVKSTS